MTYVSLFLLFFAAAGNQWAQSSPESFPYAEKLTYRIEWRLMTAGAVTIHLAHSDKQNWHLEMNLTSAGLVDRLFHVSDSYKLSMSDTFCGINSLLEGQEGKRRFSTHLDFDNTRHKAVLTEKNLVKNTTETNEVDIRPCTYDVIGALHALRVMKPEPASVVMFPLTDGKRLAEGKVESEAKENVRIDGKTYPTIRYEALIFNNVLYRRKARFFIWITDDAERIPVQLRIQSGFPVGTVTLELEKHERL